MENFHEFNNEYTLENFKQAVHILYFCNDPDLKKKADQYLCDFEKKNEAWDIAIQILNTLNIDEETCYNASQIIKKKIRFDFGNYKDVEIFKNLANFLTDKIIQFKDSKFYLLTNFCQCFALLTIFANQSYPHIIKILCGRLYDKDIKNLTSLLLVFNYLADNFDDSDIVIDKSERDSYANFLKTISDDVISFIDYIIKFAGNEGYKDELIKSDPKMLNFFRILNKNIVECLRNWINVGLSSDSFNKLSTDYIGIINFIFEINNENIESYSDCISLLLKLPFQQVNNLGQIILDRILAFKIRVAQAIQSENEDEIKFFIEIFVNLCENNLEDILTQNRIDLLQIIADLAKCCSVNSIESICDFWQKFSLFLCDKQMPVKDILYNYGNIINSIIVSMLGLIKFEDSVFIELNQNKERKLKQIDSYRQTIDFRKVIKLFFHDISKIFSFNYIYNFILLPAITNSVAGIKLNMSKISLWSDLEGEIFCFGCICRNIDVTEDLGFLDALFETIFEIPETFVHIKRTVTDVLDEMGRVLSLKPNILMRSFNYLLLGIQNPLVMKHCSISLRNLLVENKKILSDSKSDLLKIYDENVQSNVLDNDNYQRILEGIVEVICIGDNKDEIMRSVVHILSHWIMSLCQAQEKLMKNEELSREELKKVCNVIEVVKIIVRSAHESLRSLHFGILTQIFVEVWPIIQFLIRKFNTHPEIIENLTQIIKHFMRGMGSEFTQYLEDYMKLVLEGYRINPISSFIYAFEVVASVFVNDPSIEPMFRIMLKELCLQTLNFYLTTVEDYENNPNLTEDFFGLLFRLIRLNPNIIIDFDLLEVIVNICITNIGLTHIESSKNIIYFLDKLITFYEIPKMKNLDEKHLAVYCEKVKIVISKVGDSLVSKIISFILTVPPGIIFEKLKDLIIDLIKTYKDESALWFERHLTSLPQDCLTNIEKGTFVKTIIEFNDNIMDDILETFYRRCLSRLYRQN